MKRTLEEEIKRIHEIAYGAEVLNEANFLSNIWSKITGNKSTETKIDDPTKADLVSDDVQEFFNTLEGINEPVSQQRRGSMNYQKDVETIQIALEILGYDLPKYGIDGLFGPETASAVNNFKKDNNIQEAINEEVLDSPIGSTTVNSPYGNRWGRKHHGVDLKASSGTQIKSPLDGKVIDANIKDDACGGTIYIDHGNGYKTRYCHCKQINVSKGDTVTKGDIIGLTGGAKGDVGKGRSDGAHLHFELYKDGKTVDPMEHLGSEVGEYVASSGGSSKMAVVTPDMIRVMLDLLKSKGVTSEELKGFIDKVVVTGGGGIVLTSDADFKDVVTSVINTLEGGYFHPERHRSSGMGDSGETMMGIDRKHGGKINTSPEGVEFWGLIDAADAKNNWPWNYKGGELEPKLKELVGQMIKPRYEQYSKRYLTPEAANIVNQSVPLKFHFIYAVWNGPGWFQKFARLVNQKVKEGMTDPNELAKYAIDTRINSGNRIIARGGNKIKSSLSSYLV